MKPAKLISILFFLMNSWQESNAQSFNSQLANMLQDTLNTYFQQVGNIKGMSAGVSIPGQGNWIGVAGISHTGQPINTGMRMGIASNSKLFVSVMMLKLAEDRIISLDDPLSRWLPNYPNINPAIRIRQLLNHSSGISDPLFIAPWMDTIKAHPARMFTATEVLGWLGAPFFPAGTSYEYSNINYVLAGMIAKNATGFSIARLIRDSLFTPLSMDSTFYDVEEPASGTIAHRWWNTIDYHDTARTGLNSAAGCAGAIFSTPSEMLQWYNAVFNGQILQPSSLHELTNFIGTGNSLYQYGLGISRETTQSYTYWGHGGSTWGYRSKMMYDSCLKFSVTGLTNCFPSGMEAVTFLLYRAVKNHIPGCSSAITGLSTVCQGDNNVTYTVPPIPNATSYAWSMPAGITGSSSSNSITLNFGAAAQSGEIIVRGVNNYGPGGFTTLKVNVTPRPVPPVITQSGNILTSNVVSGNQWYNAAGIISGATNPAYTITSSGTYYCITTQNACSSSPSNSINAVLTGLIEIGNEGHWKISPNPANNSFSNVISGVPLNNITLRIYNTAGVCLKTESVRQQQITVATTDLAIGVYIIVLQSGNLNVRQKLVVQR